MRWSEVRSWISNYRWPLGVVGILSMSIVAQGTMVWFATRPDAPRPLASYYEKAQSWDADQAARDASAALGWTVAVDVVAGIPHAEGMPRPVDVTVRDRDGGAVTGLKAELFALRPADTRLNHHARLVELPHEPGRYRALLRLDAPGLWELGLDADRAGTRFVHRARLDVQADTDLAAGAH